MDLPLEIATKCLQLLPHKRIVCKFALYKYSADVFRAQRVENFEGFVRINIEISFRKIARSAKKFLGSSETEI